VKCWATWIQVAPFLRLRKWRKKVLPWFNLFFLTIIVPYVLYIWWYHFFFCMAGLLPLVLV
jgi:hypothetical protein